MNVWTSRRPQAEWTDPPPVPRRRIPRDDCAEAAAAEVGRRQAVAAAAARATLARACLPTFVEPFCGALAVTFGLQPDRALLNHANPHVIYRTPAREVLAVRNL